MIVAEDSLCSNELNKATTEVPSGKPYLAQFTFPDKIGLASAAAHLVHFLNPSLTSGITNEMYASTYKSAHVDPVRVNLSTGCTLNLKRIPEGIFFGIIGAQIGHSETL